MAVVTDTIADMLTRIRNANAMRYTDVSVPASKMKIELARILKEEGYIEDFKVTEDNKLVANSPYSDAVVRVTLDGSTPDETSREMKPGEAIDLAEYPDATVARAVLFTRTQHSAPVTLRLK